MLPAGTHSKMLSTCGRNVHVQLKLLAASNMDRTSRRSKGPARMAAITAAPNCLQRACIGWKSLLVNRRKPHLRRRRRLKALAALKTLIVIRPMPSTPQPMAAALQPLDSPRASAISSGRVEQEMMKGPPVLQVSAR